eukprot:Sdes_comp19593_c0_seq1m11313
MTVLVSFNFPTEKLVIPHKFDRLLEVLSKEILKEQPKNIYEFCSDFFKEELSIRNELFEEEKRLRDVTGGTSKPPHHRLLPHRARMAPPVGGIVAVQAEPNQGDVR